MGEEYSAEKCNFVALNVMKTEFRPSISNDEIKDLPVAGFEGKIVIVNTPEQLEEVCRLLSEEKIIGFDTETRPSFKVGVSYNVSLITSFATLAFEDNVPSSTLAELPPPPPATSYDLAR